MHRQLTLVELTEQESGILISYNDNLGRDVVICTNWANDDDTLVPCVTKDALRPLHVNDIRDVLPGTFIINTDEDGEIDEAYATFDIVGDDNNDIPALWGLERTSTGFQMSPDAFAPTGGRVWHFEGLTVIAPYNWN